MHRGTTLVTGGYKAKISSHHGLAVLVVSQIVRSGEHLRELLLGRERPRAQAVLPAAAAAAAAAATDADADAATAAAAAAAATTAAAVSRR